MHAEDFRNNIDRIFQLHRGERDRRASENRCERRQIYRELD